MEKTRRIYPEKNIDLAKKELICWEKVGIGIKVSIKWIALLDEFQNEEKGDKRNRTKPRWSLIINKALAWLDIKPKPINAE